LSSERKRIIELIDGNDENVLVLFSGIGAYPIEIAKSFGAKILHYEWDGNYSTPRNLGLKEATKDWILVLDGDEVVGEIDGGHARLRRDQLREGILRHQALRHDRPLQRLSGLGRMRLGRLKLLGRECALLHQ